MATDNGFDVCIVPDICYNPNSTLPNPIRLWIDSIGKLESFTSFSIRIGIYAYLDMSRVYHDNSYWSGWKNNVSELNDFSHAQIPRHCATTKAAAMALSKIIERKTLVIWYTDGPPCTRLLKPSEQKGAAQTEGDGSQLDWTVLTEVLASAGASMWFLLHDEPCHPKNRALYAHMSQRTGGRTLLIPDTRPDTVNNTAVNVLMSCAGYPCDYSGMECCVDSSDCTNEYEVAMEANLTLTPITSLPVANGTVPPCDVVQRYDYAARFELDLDFKEKVYKMFEHIPSDKHTFDGIFRIHAVRALWGLLLCDQHARKKQFLRNVLNKIKGLRWYERSFFLEPLRTLYAQWNIYPPPSLPVSEVVKCSIAVILELMGRKWDLLNLLQLIGEMSVGGECVLGVDVASHGHDAPPTEELLLRYVRLFECNHDFRNVAYEIIRDLITSELRVNQLPVMMQMWRLMQSKSMYSYNSVFIKNMRDEVQENDNQMALLLEFLNERYLQREVIYRILESAAVRYPAVMFTGDTNGAKPRELVCVRASLKAYTEYICMLKIVDPSQENVSDDNSQVDSRASVPLALSDFDLFTCVAHLFCSGLMFEPRAAFVFAMLNVYVADSVLALRASAFLHHNVGKWIKRDEPANFSYEFVKFLLCVDGKHPMLTDEERTMFTTLLRVETLRRNKSTTVRIRVPFASMKTMRKDYKKECARCCEWRSFTLINEDGVCGMCHMYPSKQCVSESAVLSCMCECKSCNAHYAVEDVAALKAQPKCHFCRYEKRVAPYVRCVTCRNKYVSANEALNTRSDWVCAVCRDISETPAPEPLEYSIPMRKYFDEGHVLRSIFDAKSLWVIYDAVMRREVRLPELPYKVDYMGKPVVNLPAIESCVTHWLSSESEERDVCSMCLQERSKGLMHKVCDRKRCEGSACHKCRVTWYGQLQPGHMVMKAWLCCPFCRSVPQLRFLRKLCRTATPLKRVPAVWNDAWRYAWCRHCSCIEPYEEHVCEMAGPVAEITRFLCKRCRDVILFKTVRHCPSCDVAVQKIHGCNHITCQCGIHWCFVCATITATAEDMYKHLNEVHGGIGGDVEDADLLDD